MNGAHLHLMLNHLPVVLVPAAAVLFAAGFVRRGRELTAAGLFALLVAGASAVPAFFSGEPAEEMMEETPGVSETLVESHEEAAEAALAASLLLGAAAAGGLLLLRRGALPRFFSEALLALAVAAAVLLGRAANLGGQIRHEEIRPGAAASAAELPEDGEDHPDAPDDGQDAPHL